MPDPHGVNKQQCRSCGKPTWLNALTAQQLDLYTRRNPVYVANDRNVLEALHPVWAPHACVVSQVVEVEVEAPESAREDLALAVLREVAEAAGLTHLAELDLPATLSGVRAEVQILARRAAAKQRRAAS